MARRAGAKAIMPMTDMFFGSREGRVADSFGNVWSIATLKDPRAPLVRGRASASPHPSVAALTAVLA